MNGKDAAPTDRACSIDADYRIRMLRCIGQKSCARTIGRAPIALSLSKQEEDAG
jgi:hypothetical protein